MKTPIKLIFIIMISLVLVQCKKDKIPRPVDTDADMGDGNYIIRSKYLCKGGFFVFRSYSNYEGITWEWMTSDNLESIKQDHDPYNSYVWKINRTGALGSSIIIYPDSTSPNGFTEVLQDPRPYYTIFQEKPDGSFHYIPQTKIDWQNQYDEAEIGDQSMFVNMISTDTSPASKGFDHDLARVFISHITDSTHRIKILSGQSRESIFSLLVDPHASNCDELENINHRPTWRSTWVCPNSTSIGNVWLVDACYTSQFVFEKID